TPFVNTVLSKKPDAVILSTDFGGAVTLKAAIRAAGYKGPVFDYTTYIPGLLQTQPNVAAGLEGGYSNSQFPPFEDGTPGPKMIGEDLKAAGLSDFVTQGASIGYWSADVLVQMLEAVGQDLNTKTFYETVNSKGF